MNNSRDYWFMKGNRQKGAFSLYVDNLPESLHWQGLWHFFGQHVDVVDAYIANKLNKRGRRFGFVTFEKEVDTLNTSDRSGMKQENSNGKVHENSRDKNVQGNNNGNAHESISDRNIPVRMNHDKPLNRNKDCVKEGEFVNQEKTKQARKTYKRIQGHVVDEELWELKRSLVGVMGTVCKTSSIISRLQSWGLGEIKVKRLGGKSFLLSFSDDELFTMLEDLEWSYLKEIFIEVVPWSEKLIQVERETWLEISGLPLHCWNQCTFERVAELWGSFEALGENSFRIKNCEKVTVLITSYQIENIDEVIEVEVGNLIFKVRVKEIGFSDDSPVLPEAKSSLKMEEGKGEIFSGSSFENEKFQSSAKSDWSRTRVEEEAVGAIFLGKDINNEDAMIREKGPWGLDLQSSRIGSKLSPVKGKLSWAATVDAKMNIDYIKRGGANTENIENFALIESHSEEEEPSAVFPELNYAKKKKEIRDVFLGAFIGRLVSN
ncbi:hypothetical protein V6N13_080174 [Hibiscus sabdariffa]